MFKRRSIRAYQDRPVALEDLREIMEAGIAAPSGVNQQPWYFVVIQSTHEMERLAQVMSSVGERLEPGLRARFIRHPAVATETADFIRKLGGAPVCILGFYLKPDYDDNTGVVSLSIAAAMENILLSAVDKGLGGCWLTAPVEAEKGDELRDLFAPGKGRLVSLLTLGYPAQEPKAPPRKDGRYIII